MWAIPTGTGWLCFKKKKKNQVMSPSPESRVPETSSDPPIGSGREPGRDNGRDNNQVSFHPKTITIAYTNTENRLNTTNNIASHYTNKIEEIKDSIVNDY